MSDEKRPPELGTLPAEVPEIEDIVARVSADRSLDPGARVGEYEIEKVLGKGGFGTVYQAVQPIIGRRVAIKVLAREMSSNQDIVRRFISEARAVVQIRHDNIIDIFSFGELDDGRHYYVMDFLGGRPLDQVLAAAGGRMSLGAALPILEGVAAGLDAAHAKGIAHRDLKPENVFVADTGKAVLLDFGIAKLLGEDATHHTRTGAQLGTPYYMSPEQARGVGVDHRTDIYAFGVMVYRLLTGEYVFTGNTFLDIVLKQVQDVAVAPSARVSGFPPALDAPILAMLAKNPADRPQSLGRALGDLRDAARDAGLSLEPVGGEVAVPPADLPSTAGGPLATPDLLGGERVGLDSTAGDGLRGRWTWAVAAFVLLGIGAALVATRGDPDRRGAGADEAGDAGVFDASSPPPDARPTLDARDRSAVPPDAAGARPEPGKTPARSERPRARPVRAKPGPADASPAPVRPAAKPDASVIDYSKTLVD
ncbi:MAG TPA: protein kinase [Kofleriaceae bacterium]|nr:protein kinase [Kofleriaceae bacterium]